MIEIINDYAKRPGNEWDCCNFAGDCVEVVTGHNPATAYAITNREEAEAAIAEHGSLRQLITQHYGDPYAGHKDGDLALVIDGGVECIGVVYKHRVVLRTRRGITDWHIKTANAIWDTSCHK